MATPPWWGRRPEPLRRTRLSSGATRRARGPRRNTSAGSTRIPSAARPSAQVARTSVAASFQLAGEGHGKLETRRHGEPAAFMIFLPVPGRLLLGGFGLADLHGEGGAA